MKLYFLIGMPACGKSFYGKNISDYYQLNFIDLDKHIESIEQTTIATLFASYGENHFRELEHRHLLELTKNINQDTIIACGGGTPCFYNNLLIMKTLGVVIYLKTSIKVLLERLRNDTTIRPLLNNAPEHQLNLLLEQRQAFYEQANYIWDTDDNIITQFKTII